MQTKWEQPPGDLRGSGKTILLSDAVTAASKSKDSMPREQRVTLWLQYITGFIKANYDDDGNENFTKQKFFKLSKAIAVHSRAL